MNSQKGLTAADIAIAVIIIVIFVGTISSGFYNYYMASTSVSRGSAALSYTIDVIETVEQMNYEDVTEENINREIQELYNKKAISTPYKVTATVQKYNEIQGNENKKDLIKILTVTVNYEMNKKVEKIQISRLITK